MGRRLALLPALVTVALAWPAAAFGAASGSLKEGVMDYQGGGDPNEVVFQLVDRGAGDIVYQVVDQPAVTIAPEAPCFLDNGQQNVMDCPADGGFTLVPVKQFTASLGDANDTITLLADLPTSIGAGGGQDVMRGGPATDELRGGQGNDNIDGSSGNDTIIGDDPPDPSNPATLQGGNDVISGGPGNDTIDGEAGADDLRGYLGDDTLNGGDGNDIFRADVGPDGTDVMNGGSGVDTATYGESSNPLTLSLDDLPNDGPPGGADNIHSDVENLIGGAGSDTLSGSAQPNSLDGGPGNDTESGADGDDAVDGGDGDDNLGGDGGNDAVDGGAGNDKVGGGTGDDSLNGASGDDSVDGGPGADSMNGGDGVDLADYSSRTQGVAVQLDDVPGDGEFGENDNVHADVENVNGGSGPDTLVGSGAGNALDGGAGEDYSDGGPGADTLTGGDAGDVLRTRGSGDPDTINCGPGPDFVIAKASDAIAADCDRADRGINQKPKRRDSAVVTPVTGSLQMSPTGIVRRVPLQDKVVLPLRSIVDTASGRVTVASAPTASKAQTVSLRDGAFDIAQSAARVAVMQFALVGGDFSVCPTAAGRRNRPRRERSRPRRSSAGCGQAARVSSGRRDGPPRRRSEARTGRRSIAATGR